YRAQSDELRKELDNMRAAQVGPAPAAAASEGAPASLPVPTRVAALEENTQLLESEIRGQYQTKVESASKYRVRLSGLVLLNLFHNRGSVDNLDFPTYANAGTFYGSRPAFGATLRQSEIGFEVFGPEWAGA